MTLVALPMACSHDDEESDAQDKAVPVQNVQTYQGTLMYGTLTKDSVVARITKSEGNISISVSTNIPYLSYDFSDVSIKVSGDTSYLRAQNQTIDAGSDAQLTLELNGMMYDNCNQLYMTITGTELTDTLFFATDKSLLGQRSSENGEKEVAPAVDAVVNFQDYADLLNGVWEGEATYDGVESGTISFTTAMDENGKVSVDLGVCKFSEKMPEMTIVLDNMTLTEGEGEEPSFGLYGTSASYKMGGMAGSLGAEIKGSCVGGTLEIGLGLSVMKKDHTIAITNAKRKN